MKKIILHALSLNRKWGFSCIAAAIAIAVGSSYAGITRIRFLGMISAHVLRHPVLEICRKVNEMLCSDKSFLKIYVFMQNKIGLSRLGTDQLI